jgi:hypothetical protein
MASRPGNKPPTVHTYDQVWNMFLSGALDRKAMLHLLEDDEVFRAWCIKRAQEMVRIAMQEIDL